MMDSATGLMDRLPTPEFWAEESNAVYLALELEKALALAGIDRDFLPEPYRQAHNDLCIAMALGSNQGILELLRPNNLDQTKVGHRQFGGKPRISVGINELNGDLSWQWFPWHCTLDGKRKPAGEWTIEIEPRDKLFRPRNEILYVRNAKEVFCVNESDDVELKWLSSSLMNIANAAANATLSLLTHAFDVQVTSRLAFKEGKASVLGLSEIDEVFATDNSVAVGYEIVDELAAERIRIEAMVRDFVTGSGRLPEETDQLARLMPSDDDFDYVMAAYSLYNSGASALKFEALLSLAKDLAMAKDAGLWQSETNIVPMRR